jgi:hypothetical protein
LIKDAFNSVLGKGSYNIPIELPMVCAGQYYVVVKSATQAFITKWFLVN